MMNEKIVDALEKESNLNHNDAVAVYEIIEHLFECDEDFGCDKEIPDEALDASLRQFFYILEDSKLMKVRREEELKWAGYGKPIFWKKFYWYLRENEFNITNKNEFK